ncbi:MAG: hypothetical protein IJO43_04850 [Bacilli bacterium]|nr:hypothetical protein [Bacilli bacterium]
MNNKGVKKRNWKDTVIVALMIAIIALILSGVISYINFSGRTDDKNNEPTNKKEYENLNVTDNLVTDLFALTRGNNTSLFFGTQYENVYYSKDKINTNELNVEFKLMLSFVTLDRDKFSLDGETTVIEEKDLKEQYLKIFGDNDYKAQDIKYNCPSTVHYNPEKNRFEYDEYCGGPLNYGYQNKLIEARKYSDKIEIYEKVVFYLLEEDTNRITYWKNSDCSDLILEAEIDDDFDINNHLEVLKTYKYTFEKNDASYTFEKVELMK